MKKLFFNNKTEYYNNEGKLHRTDGPAVEYNNGSKFWYINDKLHREDGPARELSNGSKTYHLNGGWYPEIEDFEKELIKIKLNRLKKLLI